MKATKKNLSVNEENHRLATWMGWHYGKFFASPLEVYEFTWFQNKEMIVFDDDWHPRTSIEQAMMLLEKFPNWELCYTKDHGQTPYGCFIWPGHGKLKWSRRQRTKEAAIVEAVLRVIDEE